MMDERFQPPPYPPPFLTQDDVSFLALQGWLPVLLPPHLLSELEIVANEATKFFEQPGEQKAAVYPPRVGTECGYYVSPGEKEYVTFRYRQHDRSQLELHVQSLWRQMSAFLYRIICDISRAHGLAMSAWDPLIANCLEMPLHDHELDSSISLMRVFQYYPQGFAEQHTDVGLLTLCVGGADGLQLMDHSQPVKRWVTAKWPVILIGEVTSALLKGKFRAGIHRVIQNPEGRSSIVFALRPCLKNEVDLSCFGGEGIVSCRDYFYKIKSRKHNINATKELREAQKRNLQEHRQHLHQSNPPVFGT